MTSSELDGRSAAEHVKFGQWPICRRLSFPFWHLNLIIIRVDGGVTLPGCAPDLQSCDTLTISESLSDKPVLRCSQNHSINENNYKVLINYYHS